MQKGDNLGWIDDAMPENYSPAFCARNDREAIGFHTFTVISLCLENSSVHFYVAAHGIPLDYQTLWKLQWEKAK